MGAEAVDCLHTTTERGLPYEYYPLTVVVISSGLVAASPTHLMPTPFLCCSTDTEAAWIQNTPPLPAWMHEALLVPGSRTDSQFPSRLSTSRLHLYVSLLVFSRASFLCILTHLLLAWAWEKQGQIFPR